MSVALNEVRKSALRAHAIGRVAKAVVESLESRTLLSSAWGAPSGAPVAAALAGTSGALVIAPAAVTVTIPDADLEAVIRTALSKPTGDITDEDMATLTTLDASSAQVANPIGDLTGLESATNLQSLNLSGNQIGDVSPLAGLTALTTLDLSGNRVADVTPLAGLTGLTTLNLANNQITDVSSLDGLTALTTVDVRNNSIDISAGSPSMNVIQGWIDAGADVAFQPQIVPGTNEAPTDIALSNDTIAPGLLGGTPVGTFSTTDPNAGDTFTYTLAAGEGGTDNGSFTIVGDELQTTVPLTAGSYSILVQSMDQGGLSIQKIFTVTVAEVATNEAPTDISLSNGTIIAGLPAGTAVGTFSTTDPNVGDTFTYTLVAGEGDTDNGSFTIVGDQLQTTAPLTAGTYSILVQSMDQGGLSTQKAFTVTVAANEAPTDIALSNGTIASGLPAGTAVGTFSTTDPNTGDTFTYTLVAGAGDTNNGSFTIVGNELRTTDSLAAGSYSILVQTTDQGGLSTQKTFTVTVAEAAANEAPTDISLSNDTILPGLPAGTAVGTFSTTDPNTGDTFTYTLVAGEGDTNNGSFTIVDNELRTTDSLAAGSYSILVQSTDQGGLSTQKAFTVTVAAGEGNLLGVFGMTGGKKAESLTLTDADGDKVTFTLTGGGTGQVLETDGGIQVVLTGTTAKSALTIKVKKVTGGDGEATIGGLTSDGLIKSIKAGSVIVTGPVDLNTAAQPAGKTSVALQFDQLIDASITSEGLPISSLKVLNWANTDETPDTLTAPSIGSITVSGRKEQPRTLALEFLPGDLDASVTTTGAIKSIKTAGSITGAIRSGQDAKGKGIGSITAKGSLTGTTVATSGSINTVRVGALMGSDILVGVAPEFDGRFATAAGDFATPTAKLGTLTVTGAKLAKGTAHPAYVMDSNISAPNVGTITLLNVSADTGPMVYVLTDKGTLKINQSKQVSEAVAPKDTFKAPKDDARNPFWAVVPTEVAG